MVREVVNNLIVDLSGHYVDCTFGNGGHSINILKSLDNKGSLTALDKDIESVNIGIDFAASDERFKIIKSNFGNISKLLEKNSIDGILVDLGISSSQLDNPNRGFSFRKNGPLDMRIDQDEGLTAKDWINESSKQEIEEVLKHLGQERSYKKIADAISKSREIKPISSTKDLVEIILSCKTRRTRKHPATNVFRAIRMRVNQELKELSKVLDDAGRALKLGGRLVVISFHSIEDRIVKRFIQGKERIHGESKFSLIGKKPLKPSFEEIKRNPRSRSAILRVAERVV